MMHIKLNRDFSARAENFIMVVNSSFEAENDCNGQVRQLRLMKKHDTLEKGFFSKENSSLGSYMAF